MHEDTIKTCTLCLETKPIQEFSRKGPGKTQSRCKDCCNAWANQYRKENPHKQSESDRRYRAKHREKVLQRKRDYRKRNTDYIDTKIAEWREKNPDKLWQNLARSRARGYGVEGFVSRSEFDQLCQKYEYRCLCCGVQGHRLIADHVVPLSKGGPHDISNIQPLCHSCNSRKRDLVIDYRGADV